MELVAASKLVKCHQQQAKSVAYASAMEKLIYHLSSARPEFRHPFLYPNAHSNRVGYLVISSDRGLCGSLNSALFKQLFQHSLDQKKQGHESVFVPVGQKAVQALKRYGGEILAQQVHLSDRPDPSKVYGLVKVLVDEYQSQRLDAVYLVYNQFISTMKQVPTISPLVPLALHKKQQSDHTWDYLYEPNAQDVLNFLLVRYVETLAYQSVVENIASEQAARMVAMKQATDNAGGIIDDLKLAYNKARQSAITRELAEIVGGAEAV
jgi:F-type H+-transporting ATPase subunit gamma